MYGMALEGAVAGSLALDSTAEVMAGCLETSAVPAQQEFLHPVARGNVPKF